MLFRIELNGDTFEVLGGDIDGGLEVCDVVDDVNVDLLERYPMLSDDDRYELAELFALEIVKNTPATFVQS